MSCETQLACLGGHVHSGEYTPHCAGLLSPLVGLLYTRLSRVPVALYLGDIAATDLASGVKRAPSPVSLPPLDLPSLGSPEAKA